MIRMCVSRAKWSLFSTGCAENIVLGVSKLSSKFGPPLSEPGLIGGVAYNGDIHPMSDKSKKNCNKILLISSIKVHIKHSIYRN